MFSVAFTTLWLLSLIVVVNLVVRFLFRLTVGAFVSLERPAVAGPGRRECNARRESRAAEARPRGQSAIRLAA